MIYLGSKNDLAQDLLNITLSGFGTAYDMYIEPFVGSCSVLKNVPVYDGTRVIGFDKNHYLIALLNYARVVLNSESPLSCGFNADYVAGDFLGMEISLTDYLYVRGMAKKSREERLSAGLSDEYIGYVGFFFSTHDDFFSGYRAVNKRTIVGIDIFCKTISKLQGKELYAGDFATLADWIPKDKRAIIYADPPHVGTKCVGHEFSRTWLTINRRQFELTAEEWAKTHKVYVSEYLMNKPFTEIWAARDYLDLHGEALGSRRRGVKSVKVEKLYALP